MLATALEGFQVKQGEQLVFGKLVGLFLTVRLYSHFSQGPETSSLRLPGETKEI